MVAFQDRHEFKGSPDPEGAVEMAILPVGEDQITVWIDPNNLITAAVFQPFNFDESRRKMWLSGVGDGPNWNTVYSRMFEEQYDN